MNRKKYTRARERLKSFGRQSLDWCAPEYRDCPAVSLKSIRRGQVKKTRRVMRNIYGKKP
jgi:hypothetical protein